MCKLPLALPHQAAVKSMLCVPISVHKEVLGMDVGDIDNTPTVTVLLQWVNKHGGYFNRQDVAISRQLREVMHRVAETRHSERMRTLLQERFNLGDARRVALMDSAKMLAKRMDMNQLFSAVMNLAKELMEVSIDRTCERTPYTRGCRDWAPCVF